MAMLFRLTLSLRTRTLIKTTMKTQPKTRNASLARLIDGNRNRAAIIQVIIKHNGYISISAIAKQLQLARSTVIRHIYILKYLRLIRHDGKQRGGRWQVVNCNRWDINRYMGITLQLTNHLNRLVIDEDPDESSTIGIESGTINHECSTINHECGTTQKQPMFLDVNRLCKKHPQFSHISQLSQKIHPSPSSPKILRAPRGFAASDSSKLFERTISLQS